MQDGQVNTGGHKPHHRNCKQEHGQITGETQRVKGFDGELPLHFRHYKYGGCQRAQGQCGHKHFGDVVQNPITAQAYYQCPQCQQANAKIAGVDVKPQQADGDTGAGNGGCRDNDGVYQQASDRHHWDHPFAVACVGVDQRLAGGGRVGGAKAEGGVPDEVGKQNDA